jgi:hypothetical protein
MIDRKLSAAIATALALISAQALATATAEEASHLGKDLTPVGAVKAGNADGSIPEWTGPVNFPDELKKFRYADLEGIRKKLEQLRPQVQPHADKALALAEAGDFDSAKKEFDAVITMLPPDLKQKAEIARDQLANATKPLFTITKDNMAKYADHLTDGQKALFEHYPTYKMNIYKPLRTGFYPDAIYAATIKNATSASLTGTDQIKGANLGFPFPIPKSGAEVIWNHKLKFRGSGARRYNDQAIVKPDGSYKLTQVIEDVKFKYANLKERAADSNNILAFYLQHVIAPPRVAGQMILVHEASGQGSGRIAWIFSPGLGRVNRAPDVGYDNPSPGTDGEQFNDQVDVFNGALDRYDWKLLGKKEIYIPYNSYLINAPILKYAQMFKPLHLNQALARYELHRVWIVEANLRAGLRHLFKKRKFYVDEDSWSIAAMEDYDNRDQLWKIQEAHLLTAPFVPTVTGIPEVTYDMQSHRYFATALLNEGEITNWEATYNDNYFDPSNLKRLARSN